MTAREKKAPHTASPGSLLTGWARQGVESFVAAQKILLDLAAQENALLIGMVREQFGKTGFRPGATVAGIAENGVKNLSNAGKILLDLAASETALAVEGVKEGLRLPVAAGAIADLVRHRVDTLVEMQKHFLDATAEHAHAVAESYREGENVLAAANLAELARRGIEGFVEGEKKFLDLAAQEVTNATKATKKPGKAPRERMEVFTEVVREGTEKYIETQKKLLGLAIEQLEAATKASGEHKEATHKEGQPAWGELTEKSLKNFVTAEKSLLDLAMRPMKKAGREEGRKVLRPHRVKKEAASPREPVAVVA
ncbi:MAG TPA: hypothetical protein VEI73_16195 [Candidatus Acidoferrum sp.]|nr:hypothetical protein [Candidatus Acidoferrum sp.]